MNIYETFNWIYSFEKETKVTLQEKATDLKGEVFLKKNNKGLFFKLDYHYFKLLYNEESRFVISHNSSEIKINHFLAKYDKDFGRRICEAYMFQSLIFEENKLKFHKYFSKIENVSLFDFLKENRMEFSICTDDYIFTISTTSNLSQIVNDTFLVIECNTEIEFKKFKHCVNCLIISIGFLCGYLYKKEEYYFQSDEIEFNNVRFFYRNGDKRFVTYKPFELYPENYDNLPDFRTNKNKYSSSITVNEFEKLFELIYNNPKYYSSIRMLFEVMQGSFITKHSILMVVVESITSEIRKLYHSETIEKIHLKEETLRTLDTYKSIISDGDFDILQNAINNLDSSLASNIICFELAFNALNIRLSRSDRKALKRRNNIFHGKIIQDFSEVNSEESLVKIEEEYNYYSYKIYVLICKLILKQIGFNGYLLNHPKLLSQNDLAITEPYFIKI